MDEQVALPLGRTPRKSPFSGNAFVQVAYTTFTRMEIWTYNLKMRLLLPERPALSVKEHQEERARLRHLDALHEKYRPWEYCWNKLTVAERHQELEAIAELEKDFGPRPLIGRNERPTDWNSCIYTVTTETDEWLVGQRGNDRDIILLEILDTALAPCEFQAMLDFFHSDDPLKDDPQAANLVAEIEDWFVQQIARRGNLSHELERAILRAPIADLCAENLLGNLYNYRKAESQ